MFTRDLFSCLFGRVICFDDDSSRLKKCNVQSEAILSLKRKEKTTRMQLRFCVLVLAALAVSQCTKAGIIKNIWNKVTNNNSSSSSDLDLAIPFCGSSIFSSKEEAISPEIIFITKSPAKFKFVRGNTNLGSGSHNSGDRRPSRNNQSGHESEDNVEHHNGGGYDSSYQRGHYQSSSAGNWAKDRGRESDGDRDTGGRRSDREGLREHERSNEQASAESGRNHRPINPVTYEFRFHAENVTLEELEENGFNRDAPVSFLIHGFTSGYPLQSWMTAMVEAYTIDERMKDAQTGYNNNRRNSNLVSHNLFIVNWNYAARGPILYPRAVANIVPVSRFISEFVNRKLLEEARIPPRQIQLVGHSLGAHLAGFVGKATTQKVGRIFGLDPAGPCFGSFSGALYPSDKRLSPDDAEEVISIHTNYGLLGIEAPVGRYSVYVEGGKEQADCGTFKEFAWNSLSWDGPNFDKVACSHSRAPALLTYELSTSRRDNCQLVAYECDSWEAFKDGFCGICDKAVDASSRLAELQSNRSTRKSALVPHECVRIGLEWQYKQKKPSRGSNNRSFAAGSEIYSGSQRGYNYNGREPVSDVRSASNTNDSVPESKPRFLSSIIGAGGNKEASKLFLRTSNIQPYCIYHYQVVLELSEPFSNKKPPMSIVLQDAKSLTSSSSNSGGFQHNSDRRPSYNERNKRQQPLLSPSNSLTSDDFGNKFDDRTYTQLLTSSKKMGKVEHASLIFRSGLADVDKRKLKRIVVNYMSHIDPEIRRKLSNTLCLVTTKTDQQDADSQLANHRFYFLPCSQSPNEHSGSSSRPTHGSGQGGSWYANSSDNSNNGVGHGSNFGSGGGHNSDFGNSGSHNSGFSNSSRRPQTGAAGNSQGGYKNHRDDEEDGSSGSSSSWNSGRRPTINGNSNYNSKEDEEYRHTGNGDRNRRPQSSSSGS